MTVEKEVHQSLVGTREDAHLGDALVAKNHGQNYSSLVLAQWRDLMPDFVSSEKSEGILGSICSQDGAVLPAELEFRIGEACCASVNNDEDANPAFSIVGIAI